MTRTRMALVLTLAAVTCGAVFWLLFRGEPVSQPLAHQVQVTVPELSGAAASGQTVFQANCMACHGVNAGGGPGGPPLVHRIYEPGHHADISFALAARNGVRQHHWQFGNMPPIPGIRDDEIAQIIAYVRTLQRANGIN